jgi:hypothetical protein
VLYLRHGIGGDEHEWERGADPATILDNLIADGKARPMIVVMMNSGLFVDGPTAMAGMTADKSLLKTVHSPIPYVLGGESDIAHAAGMKDCGLCRDPAWRLQRKGLD